MSARGGSQSFRLLAGHLYHGDVLLGLTPKELSVLTVLAAAGTSPVSTGRIISSVWEHEPVGSESLHRCVSTIRRKLARVHEGPTIITHNRVGYGLAVPILLEDHHQRRSAVSELVRQAMELGANRTRPALEKAMERVEQAIAMDPDYLPAYQLRGHALIASAMHRYAPPRSLGTKLITHADALLARFPHSGDGFAFRGFARTVIFGDEAGTTDLDQAIRHEPDNWLCRLYRAWALAGLGQFEASLADLDIAWKRNPAGTGLIGQYAYLIFCSGDPDRALDVLREAGDAARFVASAQAAQAIVAAFLGYCDEALAAGRRAVDVLEASPTMTAALCYALARAGQDEEARSLLGSVVTRQEIIAAPSMLAPVYMALGDRAAAAAALAAADEDLCVYRHVQTSDPRLAGATGHATSPARAASRGLAR